MLAGWTGRGRADDPWRAGRHGRRVAAVAAAGHRRGVRPAAGAAHRHDRLRTLALRRPLRPRAPSPRRAGRRPGSSPATSSSPTAPAATCASRPARTTRRSPSTSCGTWPGSGRGVVAMKWSQLGFGRTSSTSSAQATPRNLMGFLDGTRNLVGEDTAALDEFVWVGRRHRPAVDAGRQLPGRAPDPHAHRVVGPRLPARPGAGHRPAQGQRRAAGRHARARRTATWSPRAPTASRSSRSTPTSGWPAPTTTAASGSCGAATPSPTASTR